MKTIAFITVAFIVLSCSENKQTEPATDYFVVAEKNGQNWSVASEAQFSAMAADTLYIWGIGTEEWLSIHFKFNGPGEYVLGKNLGRYYTTIGGDVVTDAYSLDANSNAGVLTITHYGEHERIIAGNFSMTLNRDKHFSGNKPEEMKLTNGRFRGKIIE